MPLVRPYIALVLIRVEVRIAEMTDAVPARRIIWRRAAIAAPSPAGAPETRDSITSRPCRDRSESETYAKPAWAETKVTTGGAALVEPV
jgi:hypothetical protein